LTGSIGLRTLSRYDRFKHLTLTIKMEPVGLRQSDIAVVATAEASLNFAKIFFKMP
jgi:hypothetical protein